MRRWFPRRAPRDPDLDDEIRSHLAMAVRDRVDRGEDPREAEYAARREFGNVGLVRETTRAVWRRGHVEQFARDVRHAWRLMARAPAFSAVVVLTLALGIGANTALFTVVHAVVLQPLPFPDPGRLVAIWEESSARPGRPNTVAPANFMRWRERAPAFERMAAIFDFRIALSGAGEPEELTAQAVTADFFPMLGIPPQAGRYFTAEDAVPVDRTESGPVVLSDELWRRRFGRDPHVVGRFIRLGAEAVTVIGVMPPDARLFLAHGSLVGRPPDVWFTFRFSEAQRQPRGRYLSAVGRLKPGVSVVAAQAQMDAIAAGLRAELPGFDNDWSVRLVPLHAELSGDLRPALLVLTGAVAFVLLIACANVASLLLARGTARRREFAVRSALGAGRAAVARQLLAETIVLAGLGGVLGLLVGRWSVGALAALSPIELPATLPLNVPVLAFTVALSLVTALLCGLAPLIDSRHTDVRAALDDGARQTPSRHTRRTRRAFVVAEVALVTVLLVGAGLLVRSFAALRGVPPGFDGRVLTARVALPAAKYKDAVSRLAFFRNLVARTTAVPGVRAAGVISFLPMAGLGAATGFTVDGRPAPPGLEPVTDVGVCDAGYFTAMGIPLVRGRLFVPEELQRPFDVVIVNEALVRQQFPGEDPIGKRLLVQMWTDPPVPATIIGVVGNVRQESLATESRPATYWPLGMSPYSAMAVAVRTDGEAVAFAPTLARLVRSIDPEQPISDVRTTGGWIARSLARAAFTSTLAAVFAIFALLLASLGIYGVVAYSVQQRTGEIGVRMALGARPRDIAAMVVAGSAGTTVLGVAIGLALALALTRSLRSLLYGTSTTDPLTIGVAIAVLTGVSLAAAWLPAREAARVNPVETLRQG